MVYLPVIQLKMYSMLLRQNQVCWQRQRLVSDYWYYCKKKKKKSF